jgi:hypothetical protein
MGEDFELDGQPVTDFALEHALQSWDWATLEDRVEVIGRCARL